MRHYMIFGQAYGQGTYGNCEYGGDSANCVTVAGGSNNSQDVRNGGLSDPGVNVIFIISLACLIVFVVLLIRFWRHKPSPVQEIEEIEDKRFSSRF